MSTVIRNAEGPDASLAYWEVGHYDPTGAFHSIYHGSDWEEAACICSELNGGTGMRLRDALKIASDLTSELNTIGFRIDHLTDSMPYYSDELEKIAKMIGMIE